MVHDLTWLYCTALSLQSGLMRWRLRQKSAGYGERGSVSTTLQLTSSLLIHEVTVKSRSLFVIDLRAFKCITHGNIGHDNFLLDVAVCVKGHHGSKYFILS